MYSRIYGSIAVCVCLLVKSSTLLVKASTLMQITDVKMLTCLPFWLWRTAATKVDLGLTLFLQMRMSLPVTENVRGIAVSRLKKMMNWPV